MLWTLYRACAIRRSKIKRRDLPKNIKFINKVPQASLKVNKGFHPKTINHQPWWEDDFALSIVAWMDKEKHLIYIFHFFQSISICSGDWKFNLNLLMIQVFVICILVLIKFKFKKCLSWSLSSNNANTVMIWEEETLQSIMMTLWSFPNVKTCLLREKKILDCWLRCISN